MKAASALMVGMGVLAVLVFSVAPPGGNAVAQPDSLKEQLVGAWRYVSATTVGPDGNREAMFGSNPQGLAIFDRNGAYALLVTRSDLPKFASNNRMTGTAEEYRSIAQGSIAHFGLYTVDEAAKTITFRVETSSFPNWNGIEQKRPFSLQGDELRWTTPGASGGGTGEIVLKRVR